MTSNTEIQEKLALWTYAIQWATLMMPPAIVVPLIYLLFVRRRVTLEENRSHVNWQLTTCGVIVTVIPIALGLLFIGLSRVITGATISIVATFV